MQIPDQFRSTTFRLAIGYATLFFLSVMAMLAITYFAATAEVEGIVRRSIDDDISRFETIGAQGGAEALRKEMKTRAQSAPDDRFYLMLDTDGERMEGNLPVDVWHEGWADRKLSRKVLDESANLTAAARQNSDHEVRLFGIGTTIAGKRVFVARNSHILDETQEIIVTALLTGSLVTIVLALVGGYAVSIGPTRRVDAIATKMRLVAAGRFEVRLPRRGRRDELDRLSGDINGMLERIEVLMSSLKQVSTDIAHDLRTPLARLRQRLEGARRAARTTDDYAVAVDGAIGEADTIIDTFQALLRIAQIEAGARKAKFGEVDISGLLLQLFDVFESVAEDSGHRMRADVEPELVVFGDRDLLMQLFSNLIENALTHVPPPGAIAITARREDNAILAAISDNGPGVPEAERRLIFRRLYRLDASRTTPGSGLGLALAEAIAELHDTTIQAEDNAPGLAMRMTFPAASRRNGIESENE